MNVCPKENICLAYKDGPADIDACMCVCVKAQENKVVFAGVQEVYLCFVSEWPRLTFKGSQSSRDVVRVTVSAVYEFITAVPAELNF